MPPTDLERDSLSFRQRLDKDQNLSPKDRQKSSKVKVEVEDAYVYAQKSIGKDQSHKKKTISGLLGLLSPDLDKNKQNPEH